MKPKCDGLVTKWGKRNYVNPPYNDLGSWLAKAVEEMKNGSLSVFLIPFRPHRTYFADFIMPFASEIRFFEKPIAFKGYDRGNQFGVCLIIFRPKVRQGSGVFTLFNIPPEERTLRRLRKAVSKKFKLTFDYVKHKPSAGTVNHVWGKSSFICVGSRVDTFIGRCEEEQAKGNTVVLIIPLRISSCLYFLDKVILGKARAMLGLPCLVFDGYGTTPAPDGSLMLLYGPGPKMRFSGPRLVPSYISE